MILKFRVNNDTISSWIFEEAETVVVHKKFANEITGEHRFYQTKTVKNLNAFDNGKYPIVHQLWLTPKSNEERMAIVIPVSGSEIYLLSSEGKTIERL